MSLAQFIGNAIRQRGPVTFAWFMEQALYHPKHGYYSSGRAAIGRGGDYFTSVSVGRLFGRLLAAQFAEMWETLGQPDDFAIVEQGAHGGEFAHDVLTAAERDHLDFFSVLNYQIVEPFSILRERQTTTLASFPGKVLWHSSLVELPPFRGVHFSNELIDALPVHLVRWNGAEWEERYVVEREGGFAFDGGPLSDPRLAERLREVPAPAADGYETEINLAALDWIETLAPQLVSGFILAADYGWPRPEFFAPQRSTGTLLCRAEHRILPSPLEQAGSADITAHVEWTSLAECAEASGLTLLGFTDQHHFLTGLLARADGEKISSLADAKSKRALQTLLHPEHLGTRFQFLCLAKNLPRPSALSGLRFARDARRALGLAGVISLR